MQNIKVALVHDYLIEYGGAERVLETLTEIFPDAPVYTAYYDPKTLGVHADRIKKWNIKTSGFQKFPFARKLISPFRIFAPMMFESFDFSDYDVVISSCNIYFSKAVITKPGSLHISYIHTPPRYLYGYTTSFNYKKHWWTRVGGELINHYLRIYDFETSQRPDILVANSKNVAQRIEKFYRRKAVVIYPPVEVVSPQLSVVRKSESRRLTADSYFVSVGRLVRGKGIETIVETCAKFGLPLKVVGAGPERQSLESRVKSLGGKNIEFLGQVEDEKLPEIYANAIATIVASEDEDFGIVPVESMSYGTPVIAINAGGFKETVVAGKTGEFFEKDSLGEVLQNFDPKKYKPEDSIKQAEKFSKERFKKDILDLIEKNYSVQ